MIKSYSDAFDESDSIEVGKKSKQQQQQQRLQKKNKNKHAPVRYKGSVFPSLLRGFDDFFAPSIFGRDPFSDFRRAERMMDDMMMMSMQRPASVFELTPFSDDITLPTRTAKTLLRSSPGYRIKESKGAYEISVDIPEGLTASDMEIELENDGTVLHVSGERKIEEDDYVSQSWFDKRFTIGPNVDKDKIAANFDDGVLVMTAPKLEVTEEVPPPKHTIPISEKPHITDEELVEKNYNDAFDESDWAETGKAANLEKEDNK